MIEELHKELIKRLDESYPKKFCFLYRTDTSVVVLMGNVSIVVTEENDGDLQRDKVQRSP